MQLPLAHSPNRAYFYIEVKEQVIVVNAEFPWTIREALMNYDPQLKLNFDEVTMMQALECYFMDNFIISDENGEVAVLRSLKVLPHQGHSHQANVEVVFEHVEVSSISNTLMFERFLNQKNFISMKDTIGEMKFVTDKHGPTHDIGEERNDFDYLKNVRRYFEKMWRMK